MEIWGSTGSTDFTLERAVHSSADAADGAICGPNFRLQESADGPQSHNQGATVTGARVSQPGASASWVALANRRGFPVGNGLGTRRART